MEILPHNAAPRARVKLLDVTPVASGLTLSRLEIRSLATIDALELDLQAGLSVFTGETGAGKSIIVDALGLLLGERARSELIRRGDQHLLVTGFWRAGQPSGGEEEAAICSRRVSLHGRSVARIDGEVVPARELADWASQHLTIHWQHSAVSLLSPAAQRRLLDGQLAAEAKAYAKAYAAWQAAQTRQQELGRSARERARMLDLLQFQLDEIREVDPQIGEEEPLSTELARLTHQEAISASAAGALALLEEAEPGALELLLSAARTLQAGARHDQASAALLDELYNAVAGVRALVPELRDIAEASAPDPEEVARLESRLAVLGRLKQKYGPTLEDVLAFAEQTENELDTLGRDEADAQDMAKEVQRLRKDVERLGAALDAARQREAGPLAEALLQVVRQLGMPHARLEFCLEPTPSPGPHGLSEVRVLFGANPGERLGALHEVASGGELSRVMLAVSTVVGAETPVVVFDEVDAGIGGAAALAVASQLRALGRQRQVMVVTHLAQIAAQATHHFRVEKEVLEGRTVSRVRLLSPEEREAELARMLGGTATGAALNHARELLYEAPTAAKATKSKTKKPSKKAARKTT